MSGRRKPSKKAGLTVAGFLVSGLALAYFLTRVDLRQSWDSLAHANLYVLSVCFFTKGSVLALNATRSRILLSPIRVYSFPETFVPWLTGEVTNNILPFRLGEIVRIDLFARAGRISRGSTIAVVALDRLLDLVSFLLLLMLVGPLVAVDLARPDRLWLVLAMVIGASVAALAFASRPAHVIGLVSRISHPLGSRARGWLSEKAWRFSEGLAALRSTPKIMMAFAATILARLVGLLSIQCWLWAFGLQLPYYAPVVILLFISAGTMVPSSPAFIGTFHVACAYGLELMGVDPPTAASIAIAGHFMATVPWTVVGLFVSFPSIRRFWHRRAQLEATGGIRSPKTTFGSQYTK